MHNTRRRVAVALALVLTVVFVAGCRGSEQQPTATPSQPTPTSAAPEPTLTPAVTPTPTVSAAMGALLAPGPTMPNIEQFFFLNAGDLWQVQSNGGIVHVTRGLTLGPWSMVPDGTRAIAVVYEETDAGRVEAIRIVRGDGILSAPLYGPAPTSGENAEPPIVALDWSWDQTKLAVAFDDGSVGVLQVPEDEAQYPVAVERVVAAGPARAGRVMEWSPGGNGIAYVTEMDEQHRLVVVPLGDVAHEVVADVAVGAFTWLPGRGRLAFVQQASVGGPVVPGSVFTVAADGTARELLLSAGQFAPAATVMSLHASPDGRAIAFTVYAPGENGEPAFQSLWTLTIDGEELTRIPVATGYRAAEVWWTAQGLTWRAVSLGAPAGDDPTVYAGEGAFVLQRFDDSAGTVANIFSAASTP